MKRLFLLQWVTSAVYLLSLFIELFHNGTVENWDIALFVMVSIVMWTWFMFFWILNQIEK